MARSLLAVHEYDAVVTDIHLPDGDAHEAIHEQQVQVPGMQVVYITGDSDSRLAREVLADKPAGFLIKPFAFAELDAVLLHALSTRHPARPEVPWPARGRDLSKPIPLVLRPRADHRRRVPPALMLRIAVVVGLFVAAGFVLGVYMLDDEPRPNAAVRVLEPNAQPSIVVLPMPVTVQPAAPTPAVR
jgi:hypothetical protein